MSQYDEIEDIAGSMNFDNITEDVCEWCYEEDFYHTDECPLNPNNAFFDEEIEYGLEDCE